MMTTIRKNQTWIGGAAVAIALAVVVLSCGGTGGGSGQKSNPEDQFVLNSSNLGRLLLNVSPTEVDANKTDRLGLVAQLVDSVGNPVPNVQITFTTDITTAPDNVGGIRFIPPVNEEQQEIGIAVTDANGIADIIAVAGSSPTGTGAIVGTGAIFAATPVAFGLVAQVQVTLLDVGFIDGQLLAVIPDEISLVEPDADSVVFFNIVGGTPPYLLKNEASGIGTATLSQHCTVGCTENGGVLCVGSPCQRDQDCNLFDSPTPADVCVGPIKRCLASCAGTNCAGSRCELDSDCNDGSPTPANVCKDSGQSIAYNVGNLGVGDDALVAGTHAFTVEDSVGTEVTVTVEVSFICGNGVARGGEQCDGGDVNGQTCATLGFDGGTLLCNNLTSPDDCTFNTEQCQFATPTPVVSPTP